MIFVIETILDAKDIIDNKSSLLMKCYFYSPPPLKIEAL